MQSISQTGPVAQTTPAQDPAPISSWLARLKDLILEGLTNAHQATRRGRKTRYSFVDFWLVMVYAAMTSQSLQEASDCLDRLYWKLLNDHQRVKRVPKKFRGPGGRQQRLVPDETQVRRYRATLPHGLVEAIVQEVIARQVDSARAAGALPAVVDLLVDGTDQWTYRKDKGAGDPYVVGGTNGPGTNRKRRYLALMVHAGKVSLFCGLTVLRRGQSEVPFIVTCLDSLVARGHRVRQVMGDRWFPTYDLLAALHARGVPYVGPYRK